MFRCLDCANFRLLLTTWALGFVFLPSTFAQAPGVRIERAFTLAEDEELMDRAAAFCEAGTSLSVVQARQQLRRPRPETLKLAAPRTTPLTGRQIANVARKAFLRFGWYGLDDDGVDGFSLGAAYAITNDGVFVTCHHCVDPEGIEEGCLLAMTESDQILPVRAILAHDRDLDAAIVRIDLSSLKAGETFEPLALSADVAPGDRAFCLSDPLDAYGYFADGIVNRFYRAPPPERRRNPLAPDSPLLLRMNVSTDWAPGSSGAAVLDEFGNAIGHVSAIWSLADDAIYESAELETQPPSEPSKSPAPAPAEGENTAEKDMPRTDELLLESEAGPVLITLHEAIPAGPIRHLAESLRTKENGRKVEEPAKNEPQPASPEGR